MKLSFIQRLASLLLIASSLPTAVHAGGVRTVRIPTIPFATHPITIDGKLDDWSGAEGFLCQPVDAELATESIPEVRQLQATKSAATVFLSYDTDALYVAVVWRGSHPAANAASSSIVEAGRWWKTGEGIELHLLTDRVVHVASWPLDEGQAATFLRVGDQPVWLRGIAAGIRSAIVLNAANNGYTEEIRLPWSLLTTTGGMPAKGAIELACDIVWKDIDPKLLEKLPVDLHLQNHCTLNFLTASREASRENYLSSPHDWGDLIFGSGTSAPVVERSALGTVLTSWSIPRAGSAPLIGGDLKEWTAPFADFAVLPGLLGSRYSGEIAMQYDFENLYIAARYQTSGPHQNVMGEATQQGYRGGDALQIRISNGRGKAVNLCGWYDSAAGKPALTADQGDLTNHFLLNRGAKEAFAPNPDHMGYSQQISIPWKVIYPDQPAPKAGDHWKLTFQPWWSGLDSRFSFVGKATLAKRGALNVTYNLPADGEVTLGLYAGQKLLRSILRSDFRNKGKITDSWDGLDQWGDPIPAGSYLLRGLYHPHVTTDYVMSFGNPGTPAWPTPDNKGAWLSDEEAPQAAATDGKWVFLAAPGSEKGYAIIAVDETGQRQWGTQEPFNPRTVSLAVEGDYLYALFSGPELTDASRHYRTGGANAIGRAVLICLDKRTGQAARFTLQTPRLKVATWHFTGITTGLWELRTAKTFSPDNYAGQPRYYDRDIGEVTNAMGIAAANDTLYVALHDDNKILVLKADTGEKIDEIPVPKPSGLHALSRHLLLAVSDKQVVQIDLASKRVSPIVPSGLVAPRCVTSDSKHCIYVSDWGSSFQVKVFGPNGAFLRAIGKEGGRPWVGAWDASGMLVPTGIAVTDAGKLWVAEDDSQPKRTSVWDAGTGAFVKDYIGPTPYGGGVAVIDPADSTVAYTLGTRFKIDFAAKTWAPQAIVDRRMDVNQPFAFNGHGTAPAGKIVRRNGGEYFIFSAGFRITVYQRKGDLFVPEAVMGSINRDRTIDGTQQDLWDSDLGHRLVDHVYPEFFKGHAGDNFTWTDLNGDGLVQPEEMQWFKTAARNEISTPGGQPEAGAMWGSSIGDDWSIYWGGNCRDAATIYRIDVKGWTPAGAPIYDIKDAKPIVLRDKEWRPSSLFATHDGKVLVNWGYEFTNAKNTIECFDRDGKSLWAFARPAEQGPKDVECESIVSEFKVPGLGNVLGAWLWHGNYLPYLFTTDGLYVSSLLEMGRLGPGAAWDESFKGYYQDPKGVPYILNGATDAHHILKINGLEGGRFQAPLTLTRADVSRAAKLRELPEEKQAPKPILNVVSANQPPVIDGYLGDWNLDTGVKLEGDKKRVARIALSRDSANLYLACEVNKETPFSNKGDNWQTLFIAGDCVDLMLATNPKADPHRQSAVPGDERLLISVYQGKPIAVLYRPSVPGTTSPVQLMAARLDEIKRLDSARISFRPKGNSYTVEAAIPLKELGIGPVESGVLQGDVGVIFSDETGSNRSQRLYYYNKKTKMTADLTTEATLQPGEWGPIQFPLGKNLLKNGGFEEDFAIKQEEGWFPGLERSGARARIDGDCPHSGSQSLILEQTEPVVFPPEAFKEPTFAGFSKLANNGKGGGQVDVAQKVPVEAGHFYSFRINYRAEGLRSEKQQPGPDRGYSCLMVDFNWVRPGVKGPGGYFRVMDEKKDSHNWVQATNSIANFWSVLKPYQAPPGTTDAIVGVHLTTLAANDLPKVWIDDLELVETFP